MMGITDFKRALKARRSLASMYSEIGTKIARQSKSVAAFGSGARFTVHASISKSMFV